MDRAASNSTADVLERMRGHDWSGAWSPEEQEKATDALEGGRIVFLPELSFAFSESELRFLSPSLSDGRAKNVSFNPKTGALGGTDQSGRDREDLTALLARFGASCRALVSGLFPGYAAGLEWGRASLRPVGIDGRQMSVRKDDRRLHVDAFPSEPVQGRRILRVFANVNRGGAARVWRVGEPFAEYAQRFLPQRLRSIPGSAAILKALHITKGRRTDYDRVMLSMHDSAKSDAAYQRDGIVAEIEFPAGSTWIVYTDLVAHAAIAGQHALEQTFYLPISAMRRPDLAPIRILERMTQRRLAG
jgi:3-deoxy-D-manno-oct-2-ulosonic acid (Kdo) hydroxylase